MEDTFEVSNTCMESVYDTGMATRQMLLCYVVSDGLKIRNKINFTTEKLPLNERNTNFPVNRRIYSEIKSFIIKLSELQIS